MAIVLIYVLLIKNKGGDFLRGTQHHKKAILLIALLFAVAGLSYAFWGNDSFFESGEIKAEKKAAAEYLKEKYGQDFVIKKARYHWPALGAVKQIRIYVASKDNVPIEFFLVKRVGHPEDYFQESYFITGQEAYNKTYLDLKWEQEVGPRFQYMADNVFSQHVLVYTSLKITKSYMNQMFGRTPSYSETLQVSPEVFIAKETSQGIFLIRFFDINQGDQIQEAVRIYSFMNGLKQVGIKNYSLGLVYFSPEYEGEMKDIIEKIGLDATIEAVYGHMVPSAYAENGHKLRNSYLLREDVEKIKNASDLLRYLSK